MGLSRTQCKAETKIVSTDPSSRNRRVSLVSLMDEVKPIASKDFLETSFGVSKWIKHDSLLCNSAILKIFAEVLFFSIIQKNRL